MNHYEVLGIPNNATQEDIQEAVDNSNELFEDGDHLLPSLEHHRRIQRAYDVLIDPASRCQYDDEVLPNLPPAPMVTEEYLYCDAPPWTPFWKRWNRSHLWWIMILWLVLLPIIGILGKAIWYLCDLVKSLYVH